MESRLWGSALGALLLTSQSAGAKQIDVILNLKEKVPMESLAAQVTDPSSARYGMPFSPEEIKKLAGPSDAEYQDLIENLNRSGLTVVSEAKTHLLLTVRGEQDVIERAFSTKFVFLNQEMSEHKALRAATVPSHLGLVDFVGGLDNSRHSHSHMVRSFRPLASPSDGISPADIKSLYGFNAIYKAGFTGKGQHIAVAGYDSYRPADVAAYFQQQKISPAPKVDQVTFNGTPTLNDDSAMETEMDLEFSGMIAPGAEIHFFGSAANSDDGEAQLFTAVLDDNRAKIVNYSWGDCEAHLSSDHQAQMAKILARAVAQGVNIMVASGDTGSDGCRDGTLSAGWPSNSPWVVAVGGTTATVVNGKLAETAWNGSGGGISSIWDSPSWQSALPAPYNAHRSAPDVAFNADPATGEPALITYEGSQQWMAIGGTSIAAPQWSGLMALMNEARGSKGALGFINPMIYGFTAAQRAKTFNDITDGNNGQYSAGPGWDAVTGWGSPQASNLLNQLKSL